MTLAGLLDRAALRRPDADGVVDGARRLGVGSGARVLLALKNRLEHVLTYWALQGPGDVPTPVNFRFASSGKILRRLLQDGQYTEAEP